MTSIKYWRTTSQKPQFQNILYRRVDKIVNKKLDKEACEALVCPALELIDTHCKDYKLRSVHRLIPIQEIKKLAKEYLKKTYHHPEYQSIIPLLPAFVYIGCNIEEDGAYGKREVWKNNHISTRECAELFGRSENTVRKWILEITKELEITIKG